MEAQKKLKIQKEMLNYNHRILPNYHAKPILEHVDGKEIMVIWVPTGVMRPYKTVDHVTSKNDTTINIESDMEQAQLFQIMNRKKSFL